MSGNVIGADSNIIWPLGYSQPLSLSNLALNRELTDEVLVERVQKGDLAAFEELIKRYQRGIYTVIYNMVGNHHDTDDLVQETFIKAYKGIGTFKRRARFFTWLYRIAVNETLTFLKRHNQTAGLQPQKLTQQIPQGNVIEHLVDFQDPHRNLRVKEFQLRLNDAMMKLTPIHRMVVVLHMIQGLSHEEIAKIMKCKVGTVRSRLFYARQQLQAYLSDLVG